ncbi:MAG: hypothetical protein HYZ57_14120, partial [Acidobacteria bacterium]|nr:hypothetical protein [Acidobacteriota bacterium]
MRRRVSGSVVILLVATVLFHGTVSVPQSSWRSMDVQVDEPGSIFTCVFSVPREASRVQAMLVTREQAERFRQGRSFRWVAGSGFERSGHFSHEIERAGPYVLLFDSRLEGRRA